MSSKKSLRDDQQAPGASAFGKLVENLAHVRLVLAAEVCCNSLMTISTVPANCSA